MTGLLLVADNLWFQQRSVEEISFFAKAGSMNVESRLPLRNEHTISCQGLGLERILKIFQDETSFPNGQRLLQIGQGFTRNNFTLNIIGLCVYSDLQFYSSQAFQGTS